jgi:hypothetical protein
METPEVHVPHTHRRRREGLPQWLELAVAVTALITSVSSIVLAVGNGKTMDKLVKANSIPYLVGGFSDASPQGADVLSLDLYNQGVGPAHEKSLRVKVDGHYVRSMRELYSATIGEQPPEPHPFGNQMVKNGVRTRFIAASQQQMIFRIPKTPENATLWDRLQAAQSRWSVEYCYCSVFDECWWVANKWAEPQSVKQCTRDEPHEFLP